MICASGLRDPEGPLLLPEGDWLITEMAPERGCITRLAPDFSIAGVVAHTGRPNGLALGRDDEIWVAESREPSVLKIDIRSGGVEVVATQCDGRALLWPNDLCFGPSGALFFTDSGVHTSIFGESDAGISGEDLDNRKRAVAAAVNGCLYRLDPTSLELRCLRDGLRFPNGIAFDPSGRLYVAETLTGDILQMTLGAADEIVAVRVHGNVLEDPSDERWAGPDGMAFDRDGRLCVGVLGQGDVTILGADGDVIERHKVTGTLPTNVAFGPPGSKRIYVTENTHGQIESFAVQADGLPLHRPSERA